jgi:hypothetical protein
VEEVCVLLSYIILCNASNMGLCVSICAIHMQIIPTNLVNVILFQCIQIFSVPPYCYDFHGICHCYVCMSSVQYVV